ncbi:hypothetical protein [Roseicyclus sp.]|uniref:hypothetical protein n=1 Tax=Roseicyclus sp. TaxID=1914329 RepID=UPI003F6ABBD3
MSDICLPPPSPRDAEVQAVVLRLIEAFAFNEAHAVLTRRLAEIAQDRRTHLEDLFVAWCALDAGERPDFLTYAHHRRAPVLGGAAS